MKILVVGPIKSPIVIRLVKQLIDYGNEVLVASHNTENQKGVINLGVLKSYFNYLNFFKICKIVKHFEPDLVHAHIVTHYGLMCILQPRPLVVALWGSEIMLSPNDGSFLKKTVFRLINWVVLKRADRCHTSALHVAQEANKQYKKTACKTDVFYWGFPIERPREEDLKKIAANMAQEFGLIGHDFLVFPRGLGKVYNPETVARIINKIIIEVAQPKRVVVLRGFADSDDEIFFKSIVDTKSIIYVDRILSSDELYILYSRTSIHFSVPHSDSLGGGVVEPALFGSYPVLSNIPSYVQYSEMYNAFVLKNFSDASIDELCKAIKTNAIGRSPKNVPSGYSQTNILANILEVYKQVLV